VVQCCVERTILAINSPPGSLSETGLPNPSPSSFPHFASITRLAFATPADFVSRRKERQREQQRKDAAAAQSLSLDRDVSMGTAASGLSEHPGTPQRDDKNDASLRYVAVHGLLKNDRNRLELFEALENFAGVRPDKTMFDLSSSVLVMRFVHESDADLLRSVEIMAFRRSQLLFGKCTEEGANIVKRSIR
jgi:hypothetical protein